MLSSMRISDQPRTDDSAGSRFMRFVEHGDTDVLDKLLAEHLDAAYCQARRFLGNGSEAEDVVQDAFLRLVRFADRYDVAVPFGAWLGCLVHNAALTALRARGRRRRHEYRAGNRKPGVTVDVHADDENEVVRAAVLELPERYRVTIDLHYFAGLSQRDTAAALGIKEHAVAKRLERARDYLRSLLRRRGVSATGAVVVLALISTPTYAAPASLSMSGAALVAAALSGYSARTAAVVMAKFPVKAALAVIALVSATAGGAWIATRTHPETASAAAFSRHWDFNTADLPKDLIPYRGAWRYVPGAGSDGSGCLEITKEPFLADFAIGSEYLPLKITFRSCGVAVSDKGGFIQNVSWSAFEAFAEVKGAGKMQITDKETWTTMEISVSDRQIEVTCNGQRTNLFYAKPVANAHLVLALSGIIRIDDLTVRTVSAAELPDFGPYLSAIEELPLASRQGTVELPKLGKTVNFIVPEVAAASGKP